jgi:5'-3' exonuclease
MKYNKILIDTNNIFARAFGVVSKEETKAQVALNKAILLSANMILSLKREYLVDNGIIYLLADNPTTKRVIRKNIDPSYKADRLRSSDGYYRAIDFIILLFSYYSEQFRCTRVKIMEADDLVPAIVEQFPSEQILLVSTDMDWARSITDSVHWLDKKNLYTYESFKLKYKFYPTQNKVTLYKCLLGDVSDNIPKIPNMNEQIAFNIINNFNTVYDLLECIQKNTDKAYVLSSFVKKTLLANKDRLLMNHNLVYFNFVSNDEIQQNTIQGVFNERALSILYASLDFPSDFDKRIEPPSISFGDIFQFDEAKRK